MAGQAKGKRLDRDVWSAAALDQLAENGIDGVRVEQLASLLGVTKGSFYWHFKDRDDLHVAILETWRRRATIDLIRRIERDSEPADRLRRLLRVPFAGEKASRAAEVELAVRMWGRRDPRAKAALAEVDALRLQYLQQLLEACGFGAQEAAARALVSYSYIRVAPSLIADGDLDLTAQCEQVLLGEDLAVGALAMDEQGLQDPSRG